jgi:ferredoxin-NADP reductase
VIFRDALHALVHQYPGRLEVHHAISREKDAARYGTNVRTGRVGLEMIREFIPDPSAIEIFTCGPGLTKFDKEAAREKGETPAPRFLETVLDAVKQIGVPKQKVHREAYG